MVLLPGMTVQSSKKGQLVSGLALVLIILCPVTAKSTFLQSWQSRRNIRTCVDGERCGLNYNSKKHGLVRE
jgi:hypothetical protein